MAIIVVPVDQPVTYEMAAVQNPIAVDGVVVNMERPELRVHLQGRVYALAWAPNDAAPVVEAMDLGDASEVALDFRRVLSLQAVVDGDTGSDNPHRVARFLEPGWCISVKPRRMGFFEDLWDRLRTCVRIIWEDLWVLIRCLGRLP